MGGHHHQTNTVVNTTTNKNINSATDNNVNNVSTTKETNTQNNTLDGDKITGGMLYAKDTVNSGTAYYKLMNLR